MGVAAADKTLIDGQDEDDNNEAKLWRNPKLMEALGATGESHFFHSCLERRRFET